MAGVRNPSVLKWRHDGKNIDGSDFDAAKFGGWQLDLNGEGAVSVPLAWETDGQYEAPIEALELPEGDYTARLRLVTRDGVQSDWSNTVQFEIRAVPTAPLELSVA